ncbi:MAG: alpha/beta fold hydrolase [Bdellovibrionaceae bacterium]|nr:alpha/beta fold hydrolase [Pseudobdellovibrionaceae bacterium]
MKKYQLVFIIFLFLSSCSSFKKKSSSISLNILPLEKIGKRFVFEKYKTANEEFTYYYFPSKNKTDPIIINVQGSGCDSIYSKDKKGNVFGGLHLNIAEVAEFKSAVLAVEKPYVETYQESASPGDVNSCSNQFREKFNLSVWVKALATSLSEVIALQDLSPDRIIVFGHSEGASVAATLAASLPQVSHVIYAAGGGGNPLYEAFLRRKKNAQGNLKTEDNDIKEAINDWKQMLRAPENTQQLFWGHAAPYWLSRSKINSVEDLKMSLAKIYVVQGTNDLNVSIDASDLLVSELVIAGKDLEYKRIIGANHFFEINGEDRITQVISESLNWALKP